VRATRRGTCRWPRHWWNVAGPGGALFRATYRDFLAESATIVVDDALRLGHRAYAEIAPLWTEVSERIAAAGLNGDVGELHRASAILTQVAGLERHTMEILSRLERVA
jgi:hypothetical protein